MRVLKEALEKEDKSQEAQEEEQMAMAVDPDEKQASGVLKKARMIVAFFNRSTQAMDDLRKLYISQFRDADGQELPTAPTPGTKGRLTNDFGMTQDVVTRWWSTHNMLARLLLLKSEILQYTVKNHGYRATSSKNKVEELSEEEWDALEQLTNILKPFRGAQKQLEGNKYVTSSLVGPMLFCVQSELERAADNTSGKKNVSVVECADAMLKSFKARYGDLKRNPFNAKVVRGHKTRQVGIHPSLMVAHALDPRFKSCKMLSLGDKEKLWKLIVDKMVDIEWGRREKEEQENQQKKKERQKQADGATAATAVEVETPVKASKEGESSAGAEKEEEEEGKEEEKPISFDEICHQEEELTPMSPENLDATREHLKAAMKLELNTYKGTPGQDCPWEKTKENNPLEWWEENHHKFPNVWQLAEEYLAIPATSASSERAFSSSGNILTLKRVRLNELLVDDGVLLKENQPVIDDILSSIYGDFVKYKP